MARKITVEALVQEGVPRDKATAIVTKLNTPLPKIVTWQFKATQKQAEEVARAFPKLEFEKRYKPRKKK